VSTPQGPVYTVGGWLRVAGRSVQGRRAYALEDNRGILQFYVSPQPGVDLESYLNRNIQLTGPIAYHCDWRAYLMNASQVVPVQ
jgi:hypothetical protein